MAKKCEIFKFRVDEEISEQIAKMQQISGLSRSDIIREALLLYLMMINFSKESGGLAHWVHHNFQGTQNDHEKDKKN